jgi:hypothetical protein
MTIADPVRYQNKTFILSFFRPLETFPSGMMMIPLIYLMTMPSYRDGFFGNIRPFVLGPLYKRYNLFDFGFECADIRHRKSTPRIGNITLVTLFFIPLNIPKGLPL